MKNFNARIQLNNISLSSMDLFTNVNSPESMIQAIKEIGIIPFSKNSIPGWSIQEITDPDFWFTTSDQLGPWDWKVEAVREGIVYGKFVGRKSAFATEECFRHLMNWRRSLPKYQIPLGAKFKPKTLDDKLMMPPDQILRKFCTAS